MSDNIEKVKTAWSPEMMADVLETVKVINRFILSISRQSIYGGAERDDQFPFYLAEDFATREGKVSFESLPDYVTFTGTEQLTYENIYNAPAFRVPKQLRPMRITEAEIKDLDNMAFTYFLKYSKTSLLFVELMIFTVQYYDGVADIDESLLRYSRVLQYIDPEDRYLQKMVFKLYAVWQTMRFPNPKKVLPLLDYTCDCSYNPAILQLFQSDACEHVIQNYPYCADEACNICTAFRPIAERCRVFVKASEIHDHICTFYQWQSRLKSKDVLLLSKILHNFNTGQRELEDEPKANVLEGKTGAFSGEQETVLEKGEVETKDFVNSLLIHADMAKRTLARDHLQHVVNCQGTANLDCQEELCPLLKMVIHHHPELCTRTTGCLLCCTFTFIYDYHNRRCGQLECTVCHFLSMKRASQKKRLSTKGALFECYPIDERPRRFFEKEYFPPSEIKVPIKNCTFMNFYKDSKVSLGCGSPPEALAFLESVSQQDDCPVCGTKHYCNFCQLRLQRRLQSMQSTLSDWLVNTAEMKLSEAVRWTSLEIILKRASKQVKDGYTRLRETLLPGHTLDYKFMELLFKKDIEKSIKILTTKLDKKEYWPDSYDQRKNNATKGKPVANQKSEAAKKKEMKEAKKKDSKINIDWKFQTTGCALCSSNNMCEVCSEHMKKMTLKAQESMRSILKEYGVLSQEDVDHKRRLSFLNIFRKLEQDKRELIGKRIVLMVEKIHDENVPLKYIDVWFNTDVTKNNSHQWKKVIPESNSRITTTQALLSSGSRPLQPAAQTPKPQPSKASNPPKKAPPKKTTEAPASQTPHVAPTEAGTESKEQSPLATIVFEPCPKCPSGQYCKHCRTEKLCELQHGMLIAREFHKIQSKCGKGATKEAICAVLEEADVEKLSLMLRWKSPEQNNKREQLASYLTGVVSADWGQWMVACQEQVKVLQEDKRIKQADYEKMRMPLAEGSEGSSVVVADKDERKEAQSSPIKSSQAAKQQESVPDGDVLDPNYNFGLWDEYEPNEFGYTFTYEGNVPVVILPKRKYKMSKEVRQIAEALETAKQTGQPLTRDQQLAEHICACHQIGECEQCREFLLPLVRHYRGCHQPSCQRCESGRKHSPNMYQWSREGDNLAEAIALVEKDLIRQRDWTPEDEEEEYDEPYDEEEEREGLQDQQGNCESVVGTGGEKSLLPVDEGQTISLGYVVYIPEDYQADKRQYLKLNVDIANEKVHAFIIAHCDSCELNDASLCHLCFLVCVAYNYHDHMYKNTPEKCKREAVGYCNICDMYLHSIEDHMRKCPGGGCTICIEIKKLIGTREFSRQKKNAIIREKEYANGTFERPPATLLPFGNQEALTVVRLREEMIAVNLHVQNCIGDVESCSLCHVEYSLNCILEHLPKCTGANVECDICHNHGAYVAGHLMACGYPQCTFCITTKRARGQEWFVAKQKEYLSYHGYDENYVEEYLTPQDEEETPPDEGFFSQLEQSIRAPPASSEETKSVDNPLSSTSSSRSASSSLLYDSMFQSSQIRSSHQQRSKKKTEHTSPTKEPTSPEEPSCSNSDDDVPTVDPNVVPNPIPFKPVPSCKKYKFTKFTESQMEQLCPHITECSDRQCPECEKYYQYLRHRNDCKNLVSKCVLCSHFEEAKIIHIQRCPDIEQCKYCKHARRAMGQEAFSGLNLYITEAAELFEAQHTKAIKPTAVSGRRNQRKVRQS